MRHHSNGDERRSSERVSIQPDRPVHLEVNVDGSDVAMLVENLSTGGATVIYPEDSNALKPGSQLRDCALDLPNVGRVPVNAVVRWRIWPKIGVQFSLSTTAQSQIEQFLGRG